MIVEDLAKWRASLDAGEDREEVLLRLGQSSATWQEQEERLLVELADEADRGSFERIQAFRLAYDAEWSRLSSASSPGKRQVSSMVTVGARPEVDLDSTSEVVVVRPALPFRRSGPPALLEKPRANPGTSGEKATQPDANDSTAEIPAGVPAPALPFGSLASIRTGQGEPGRVPSDVSRDASGSTLELKLGELPKEPLPFRTAPLESKAEEPPPPPKARRLIRFDPQTGEPLAEPTWVDLPDPAASTAQGNPKR